MLERDVIQTRGFRNIEENGEITGYRMRCEKSKLTSVRALQQMGFETIAAGDSFNDLEMIRASKAGFLFRSTPSIIADNPDLPAFEFRGCNKRLGKHGQPLRIRKERCQALRMFAFPLDLKIRLRIQPVFPKDII